jgi:DNA-binding IclR family transcriptional regulator
LELLAKGLSGLRIEQIIAKRAFAKTTVYRIIRTLVVSGYLIHKGDNAYSLRSRLTLP